jgi:uncharacterized membrane protein YsdA (DUF1294 family)
MSAILIAALLAALNMVTFFAFWFDKQAAIAREWRIPEARLLYLALVGGSPAAWIACHLLRHKTKKQPFRGILLAIIGGQICLAITTLLWLSGAMAWSFS